MSSTHRLEPLANYHCRCGENPLWDERRKVVYWTDIPAGKLFRLDAATGGSECFYEGGVVGGFTLQEDGKLLLFGENRICLLDPDGGGQTVLAEDIDPDIPRFNDVIADPLGRVFAGTMGRTDRTGGLYRVDLDGSVTRLFQGTGTSNGMGFAPDRRRFYWTDSTARKIFRFAYDPDGGALSGREVFLAVSGDEGVPDGMTVDAEGNVWSARWDGWALHKYSPDGEALERIDFPVAKVSSVIFGGADLDELYVTTAGGSDDADTPDGTLYRIRVDAKGLPEFRSRVGLSD